MGQSSDLSEPVVAAITDNLGDLAPTVAPYQALARRNTIPVTVRRANRSQILLGLGLGPESNKSCDLKDNFGDLVRADSPSTWEARPNPVSFRPHLVTLPDKIGDLWNKKSDLSKLSR